MEFRGVNESNENYLKAILILHRRFGEVRRVELARYLGFSKASITNRVALLTKEGYLESSTSDIILTPKGQETAERILAKNRYFTRLLISCGVERETAEKEACSLEHVISDDSFMKLEARYLV